MRVDEVMRVFRRDEWEMDMMILDWIGLDDFFYDFD